MDVGRFLANIGCQIEESLPEVGHDETTIQLRPFIARFIIANIL